MWCFSPIFFADFKVGVEAFAQFATERVFIVFACLDLSAGELPLQGQHRRLATLGNEVPSISLENGGDNADDLFHGPIDSSLKRHSNLPEISVGW